MPGDYYILVRTDIYNEVRESIAGEQNNVAPSADPFHVDCWELPLDQPDNSHQLSTDTEHFFRVPDVPEGEDLLITLDCADDAASTELYVRYEAVPDHGHYDFAYSVPFNADHEIVVPGTQAGAYYVLVRGDDVPAGPSGYEITARLLPFEIRAVTPEQGGNVGAVTVRILGGQLTEDTEARLESAAKATIIGGPPMLIDTAEMYVTFDLLGAATGLYDVVIEKPSEAPATLEDGFQINDGMGPNLRMNLAVPPMMRLDAVGIVWVQYENLGDADAKPPLFIVSNTFDLPFRLFPEEPFESGDVQLLGINFDGPVAVLPPGSSNSLPVYFHATEAGIVDFALDTLLATDDTPIDWPAVDSGLRPPDADPAVWDPMFAELMAQVGSTWGDYLSILIRNAETKAAIGEQTYDVRALFQEQVDKAYAEALTTVTGHVRMADGGAPVADALVRVLRTSTSGGGGASGTTDSNGRFVAQYLAPGTYRVTVEDYYPAQLVELPPDTDVVEVELSVYPAAGITGTVRDAGSGALLAEVTVTARSDTDEGGTAVTSTEGSYAITGLPAGTYIVRTTADQYIDDVNSSGITLESGETVSDVDFTLTRGGYIAGRVTDDDTGDPIADAFVFASDDLGAGRLAITNSNGEYEITGLAEGDWDVSARSTTHLSSDPVAVAVVPPNTTALDLALTRGGSISGVVRDQDGGSPIEGAVVRALSPDNTDALLAITDALGAYEISPVRTGTYAIEAKADFFIKTRLEGVPVTEGEAVTGIDLDLPPGHVFEGLITDSAGGAPIPEARITLTVGTNGFHYAYTDDAGEFAITDLIPGLYYAQVAAGGFSTHQQIVEIPETWDTTQLDLSLSTGSMLSGVVTEADGITPVQALVMLRSENGALLGVTHADEGGYYQFNAVPVGAYRVQAWDDLFAYEAVPVSMVEKTDATVDCIAGDASVQGTVTSNGAPVADTSVVVKLSGAQPPDAILLGVATDELGHYEFPALPPGTYWITAAGTNGLGQSGRYETFTSGAPATVNFALIDGAILHGSVQDVSSAVPIAGAQITMHSLVALADDPGFGAETDELGDFEIADVAPGAYRLTARATGYMYFEADVTVTGTGDNVLVEMSTTGAELLVTVREDGTGLPIPEVAVSLMRDNQTVAMGHTGEDGTLSLAPLSETDYELVVRSRHARRTSAVTVSSPSESVTVDLVLPTLPGLPEDEALKYHETDIKCRIDPRDSIHAHASPDDWCDQAPPPSPPACPEAFQDEYEAVLDAWKELIRKPCRDLRERFDELDSRERSLADLAAEYDAARGALLADVAHLITDTVLDIIPIKKVAMVISAAKGLFFGIWNGDWTQIPGIITALKQVPGVSEVIDILGMPGHACEWIGAAQDCLYWGRIYWEQRREYDAMFESFKAGWYSYITLLNSYEGKASITCCELYCGGSKSARFDCDVCDPDPPDPPKEPEPTDKEPVVILASFDPNEKHGPAGFGDAQFVSVDDHLPFIVYFENKPEASGPAQEVIVTDPLSPDLDWRTFQLGEIVFGDTVIEIPERRAHYFGEVELSEDLLVRIDAGLNIQTGQATWILTAIDPETGEIPEDPMLGLLPPNDPETHEGEGHVMFTIRPRSDVPTGTEVTNDATIVFDVNEPIDTNEVFVTIDADDPTSAVDPVPDLTEDPEIPLTWAGADIEGGSGLAGFAIFVSVDGGPFAPFISSTIETEAVFPAEGGHTYAFYSLARDNAGNVEDAPPEPDAAATVLPALEVAQIAVSGDLVQRSNLIDLEVSFTASTNIQELIDSNGILEAVTLWRRETRSGGPIHRPGPTGNPAGKLLTTRTSKPALGDTNPTAGIADLQFLGEQQVPLSVDRYAWDAETTTLTIDLTADGFGGGDLTMLTDGNYELRLDTDMITSALGNALPDTDGTADGIYRFGDQAEHLLYRLAGDGTGDRTVDSDDMQLVRNAWLTTSGNPGYDPNADMNSDGGVNFLDLQLVRANWLKVLGF